MPATPPRREVFERIMLAKMRSPISEGNRPFLAGLLHEHAAKGGDAEELLKSLDELFEKRQGRALPKIPPFDAPLVLRENLAKSENLPQMLAEAGKYAETGSGTAAIKAVVNYLAGFHPAKFGEALEKVRDARPHLIAASRFLHGVESTEEHERVSAPLFDQVLKTYETKLPQMGEKAYWQWIRLSAKQLKASIGNVK